MELAVSVHEAPDLPGDVHLVEVHDARGGSLCRLFLQPTRDGCQVQLDALEASLRVVQAASTVLIGVRCPRTS